VVAQLLGGLMPCFLVPFHPVYCFSGDGFLAGPTVPDPSTFADCLAILEKYHVTLARSIMERLNRGSKGDIEETPGYVPPF
jgi:hypothetical protein